MRPRVLFVGAGKGSWEVRGRQIGAALQARVTVRPTDEDWRWADAAVLVKGAVVFAHGAPREVPLIWDVLDSWRQPQDNQRTPQEHAANIRRIAKQYRIARLIGATRQMAEDIGGVYIPHHARPGLRPTPPRGEARVVAYEGTRKYLDVWLNALEAVCRAKRMAFAVNPPSLDAADVVVALRAGKWDGPLCRAWKSGVKYVNALVAGKPVITQACAGADEIKPVGFIVEHPDQLVQALDAAIGLRDEAHRVALLRAPEFTLEAVAGQYRALVLQMLAVAA